MHGSDQTLQCPLPGLHHSQIGTDTWYLLLGNEFGVGLLVGGRKEIFFGGVFALDF